MKKENGWRRRRLVAFVSFFIQLKFGTTIEKKIGKSRPSNKKTRQNPSTTAPNWKRDQSFWSTEVTKVAIPPNKANAVAFAAAILDRKLPVIIAYAITSYTR